MTKRAMLWLVGLIAFGFTFLSAANASPCSGLGSVHDWFASYCSDSLPTRLGVMSLGLIVLVICGYFGEKGQPPRSTSASAAAFLSWKASASRVPSITWNQKGDRYQLGHSSHPASYGIWDKQHPGPPILRFADNGDGFSEANAQFRKLEPGSVALGDPVQPTSNTYGFGAGVTAPTVETRPDTPPAPTTTHLESNPDFKTCPDCAEQVRFAARKCRFCGFQFESSTTPVGG